MEGEKQQGDQTKIKNVKNFALKVVASLERVETQYAMMGQKLSEAVQAMGKIQTKVEEMKKDLELAIREKMELESRKAELISELEVALCLVSVKG